MGERENNRGAVEHMAAAYKKHEAQRGNHLTAQQAKDRVSSVARTSDAKRDAGALRNRRTRTAPDTGKASGKAFIDHGRKKG